MSRLSAFSPEEREIIISLPYRAGLHVSYADDEGGEQDDEQEMKALEACIRELAKAHEKSPLIVEISDEILNAQDKWETWTQGVFNIEPQCKQAVAILKDKVGKDERKQYKLMVMSVASAVAQAYGEFGEDIKEPDSGFFGGVMKRIVGGMSGAPEEAANHPMNVSATEDDAIARIKAALTTDE